MTSPMPDLLEHVVGGPSIHDYVLDGSKVRWYGDRIQAWERGERIAPVTIDAAITRKCNYACEFCFAQMQANEGAEITRDIFFSFLEDAADIGVKGVSYISDGESTVSPFYVDAVKRGKEVGLAIGAGSNGLLLTRDVLEEILPSLSYLRFNFSAGERKRYAEIMGVKQSWYDRVVQNVKDAMEIKRRRGLSVTVNMQFVCDPKYEDQIIPFGELAASIRPSYAIIKHCADDSLGTLGTDYSKYEALTEKFKRFEAFSDEDFRCIVKWNRIKDEGKRQYSQCFGPPYIMQLSGSGLIAPCGFLFGSRYTAFHIGNICHTRFRDIWASDRYWEVMGYLGSDQFDPRTRCGSNCLQHMTNDWLFKYKNGMVSLPGANEKPPPDLEFL